MDEQLAAIADKQARTAKAIAADDDASSPLIAELNSLSALKAAAQAERDELRRRIADRAAEEARMRTLARWCAGVGENLGRLSYAEKRLALDALRVEVRVWREGDAQTDGTSLPRWEVIMRPAPSDAGNAYRVGSSARTPPASCPGAA